jgi:hypothetical protein
VTDGGPRCGCFLACEVMFLGLADARDRRTALARRRGDRESQTKLDCFIASGSLRTTARRAAPMASDEATSPRNANCVALSRQTGRPSERPLALPDRAVPGAGTGRNQPPVPRAVSPDSACQCIVSQTSSADNEPQEITVIGYA